MNLQKQNTTIFLYVQQIGSKLGYHNLQSCKLFFPNILHTLSLRFPLPAHHKLSQSQKVYSKKCPGPIIFCPISGDHTLSSRQQRPAVAAVVFLWVQYTNHATPSHYYHCSNSLASGQIMQKGGLVSWKILATIKPDGPTHSLYFCHSYQIGNIQPFHLMCF